MRWNALERSVRLATYICDTGATVRAAAKKFEISKSTVHKDVTSRLREVDKGLFDRTADVLKRNKEERHLRGGAATRAKYRGAE